MAGNTYIYGAGMYARILCSYLKIIKQIRISGFIVSSKNGNSESIFGISVYSFDDIKHQLDGEDVIYIAVSDQYTEDIISILEENNINSYVTFDREKKLAYMHEIRAHFTCLPMDNNKIIVECQAGNSFCCNPKYIVEYLHEKNLNIQIVWGVQDVNRDIFPSYVKLVDKYSEEYYKDFYTSRLLISNAGIPFNVRREGQYHIETWHGIGPLKKCGYDAKSEITEELYLEALKDSPDMYLSGSQFNVKFYNSAYHYEGRVMDTGFPRNDIFFEDNTKIKEKVRRRYNIAGNKKIVLYAPTFRGGKSVDSFKYYNFDIEKIVKALNERFDSDFVFMGRYHQFISNYIESSEWSGTVINCSDYPDSQEVLATADVLISDYSSIMWDFSLQYKPVFLYHNDEKEYMNERGFYCPLNELPYPAGHSSDELCNVIKQFDFDLYSEKLKHFFIKYGAFDKGNATEQVVNHILKILKDDKYNEEYK